MYKVLWLVYLIAYSAAPAAAKRDTFSVFFQTGAATLAENMQAKLDAAMYNGTISGCNDVWLVGYADDVGGVNKNLLLSQARANAVKAYLLHSGFQREFIKLVAGKGKTFAHKAAADDAGDPNDRRVDILSAPSAHASAQPPIASSQVAIPSETPLANLRPHKVVVPPAPSVDIDLGKLAVGDTLRLSAIYFSAGHSRLTPDALPTLNALYRSMAAHPNIRIRIEGHICCTPETDPDGEDLDTHKLELSLNRAKSVRDFLIRKGIAESRMECEGFGRRKPIVKDEMTEREAILNRRVEIRILE